MLGENILLALQSIRSNALRAALTAMGITVGVFSVVLIVALGRGVEREVVGSVQSLGANIIFIFPSSDTAIGPRTTLSERDIRSIEKALPEALSVTAVISGSARAQAGAVSADTLLRGVGQGYPETVRLSLVDGRFFLPREVSSRSSVVVLGRTVAEALPANLARTGQRIRINGVSAEIVGIAASTGGAMSGDPNDFIITPIGTGRQRFGLGGGPASSSVNTILVELPAGHDLTEAQNKITTDLMRQKRVSDDLPPPFGTSSTRELAESTTSLVRVVQLFLSAIASISILVGSIGITNIMLVTVHERIREIGLRMAVGASRSMIRNQFLTEAALLCFTGGLAGACLAAIAAAIISLSSGFPVSVRLDHIVVAFILSVLIGLLAGYLPARMAAKLNPIDALRRD